MTTATFSSATPFCIEDNILNLYEGSKLHSFYLTQIDKMYLTKRKLLQDAGFISQWLHSYLATGYKLHIVSTDGQETTIPVRNSERQAFIELISQLRKTS